MIPISRLALPAYSGCNRAYPIAWWCKDMSTNLPSGFNRAMCRGLLTRLNVSIKRSNQISLTLLAVYLTLVRGLDECLPAAKKGPLVITVPDGSTSPLGEILADPLGIRTQPSGESAGFKFIRS